MHGVAEGDAGLLDLARVVLEGARYRVTAALSAEPPVLLAEDENNVVAVTAVLSPEQIVVVEPSVSRVLSERLVQAQVPEKRWDGYVVLLCAQRADTEQSRVLAELANNLRQLRRVIRVGVQPTHAAVARALRPLLPLPTPVLGATLDDPLDALSEVDSRWPSRRCRRGGRGGVPDRRGGVSAGRGVRRTALPSRRRERSP